jgi:phage host-nuclease inhibitor protein Gam
MSARPRRKAASLDAPQTIEQATQLLADYALCLTQAEQIRADADAAIAEIQSARDGWLKPLDERMKTIFGQLRTWWAVAAPHLTDDGKRRSVEIAGCIIGHRTSTPRLDLGGAKAEDLVQMLLRDGLQDVIRTKHDLDKQTILRELGRLPLEELGERLTSYGLSRRQRDEFFIDRASEKPAPTETIETEDAA